MNLKGEIFMLEKVKSKFNTIVFVLSIVAIALLTPFLFSSFFADFTETNIMNIIFYALLIAANVFLLIYGVKKDKANKSWFLTGFILFFASLAFYNCYTLIKSELYENILYIALYVAIIILAILSLKKKSKVFYAFQILLSIVCAMNLTRLFIGSYYNTSVFITSSIFMAETFLRTSKEEEEE